MSATWPFPALAGWVGAGPDAPLAGFAVVLRLQDTRATAPLPAEPPIGGIVWTVVIPALLLIGSVLATWALYRRFAREDGE
jgi:hypothetical protein